MEGSEVGGVDFTTLDPMIIPCASQVTLFDGSVVGADDDCVWDKDAVMNYMGSAFNLLSYYNQQEFKEHSFDIDDRIEYRSELHATFASTKEAHFTEAWVGLNELEDSTDFFQLG